MRQWQAINQMKGQSQVPQFTIKSTATEFNALENDWTELFKTHGRGTQLFQTYNWNWHWLQQQQNAASNLCVLTGYIEDELVLLAPLILTRPLGLKILEWMGAPLSQYGDILIKDDVDNSKWIKSGLKFIKETIRPDLFHLRKTRFDAAITPLMEKADAAIIAETTAPYIECRGAADFTEFNNRYSQRSRKSKRRHRRKLEQHGDLKFNVYSNGREAAQSIRHALTLKRQWLKHHNIFSPAFQGDLMERFFINAATSQSHPIDIRVSELTVGDQPAAIEIGIIAKNHYGAHVGAYDKSFIQHSPGSLQMQDTIAALIKEDIKVIDLFAPHDPYKLEWTDQSTPVYDFALPLTLKGKAYQSLYLMSARPALKRIAPTLKKFQNLASPLMQR